MLQQDLTPQQLALGDTYLKELVHALRLNGTWTMPRFEGHSGWVKHLAGGWQTAVVANIRSGAAVDVPGNVDIIGDVNLDDFTKGRWFNTCTLSANGMTRNACADPGVDERAADPGRAPLTPAQIRVDLYNLTGAVQWPGPSTATNNFTTFGTVASTQSNDPRFVMLTFKIQNSCGGRRDGPTRARLRRHAATKAFHYAIRFQRPDSLENPAASSVLLMKTGSMGMSARFSPRKIGRLPALLDRWLGQE